MGDVLTLICALPNFNACNSTFRESPAGIGMPFLEALPTALGAAAILPAIMLLWLVVATDHRPEPPGFVWGAFLLGIIALLLARYIGAPLLPIVHSTSHPWPSVFARAFLVAAIPEETAKVLVIELLVMRLRAVHEPMDGLVYGAAVGLGFAAWENVGYLLRNSTDWAAVAVLRDILTVPFHGSLGIIAGSYLAAARFSSFFGGRPHANSHRVRLIGLAWLIPVGLHAAFDVPVLALRGNLGGTVGTPLLQTSALVVGFGSIVLAAFIALRSAAHQKPLVIRRGAIPWRAVWAMLTIGIVSAFAGAALLAIQAHRYWIKADIDILPGCIGSLLVFGAVVIFVLCRQQLFRGGFFRHSGTLPR